MGLRLGFNLGFGQRGATGPAGPTVPEAPTIGVATAGAESADVAFTPNGDGGSAITGFTAIPHSPPEWDPAFATATMVLSNGDLTITALDSAGGDQMRSLTGFSTGKLVGRFVPTYTGEPGNAEVTIGVRSVDDSFGVNLDPDGYKRTLGSPGVDIGLPFASGQPVLVYVDCEAGMGWFVANGVSNGDPEAGTNPDFTFTPGTPLALNFYTFLYSYDDAASASLTIDPDFSSGTFRSWDMTSLSASGASSPITVPSLPVGQEVTFTVLATNAIGDSAESAESNAVTPTAPVTFGWDAENKGTDVVISNGDLTAEMPYTDYPGYPGYTLRERVRGTIPRSTGKYAFAVTPTYQNAAGEGESVVGVGDSSFAATAPNLVAYGLTSDANTPGIWLLQADGFLFNNSASVDISLPFASGSAVFFYIDLDAGNGWIDTVADTTAADREAGTNPTFTFTPNSELWPIACLAPSTSPTGVALVDIATHSSGTFLDWSTP